MTADHPTVQRLVAYGLGKIDDRAAADVLRHLDACAVCRDVVAGAAADSFVGHFREADARTVSYDETPTAAPAARAGGVPPELLTLTQYTDITELGRGGMGVVYKAHNVKMDRPEVLKVIRRSALERGGTGAADRFVREVRAAAKLQHPNVVTAYTLLEPGDLLVFAMEYVPGRDLARLVADAGPLAVPVACSYVYAAALGLEHAHGRGMVHRDVKPSNLILTRKDGKPAIKVLDFGLAKVATDAAALTDHNTMMGTPAFIAPEQAVDAARADIRADVYSLGCTLYYLLTGRPPFTGKSLMEVIDQHRHTAPPPLDRVRPGVPAGLAAVVARMLAKKPADRYQTPAEVAQAVRPYFGRAADKATPPRRGASWGWRAAVGSVTLAVVLAVGLIAVVRVKTPHGVLEVRSEAADAELFVDGEKVTVTWAGGAAEVTVSPGTHAVEVRKDGLTAAGETVTVTAGGRAVVTARLAKATPPVAASPAKAAPPANRPAVADAVAPVPPPAPLPGPPLVFGDRAPALPDAYRVFTSEFNGTNPRFATEHVGVKDGHFVIAGDHARDTMWDIGQVRSEGDYAVEAVGRVRGVPPAAWGIDLMNYTTKPFCGVNATVSAAGTAALNHGGWDEALNGQPLSAAVWRPGIRTGAEYNRVLIVSRGNELMLYVNGERVCGPVRRPASLTQPIVRLSSRRAAAVELDRLAIYALPPAPPPPATEAAAPPAKSPAAPPPAGPLVFGKRAPNLPDAYRVNVLEFDEADSNVDVNEYGARDGHYVIIGERAKAQLRHVTRVGVDGDFAVEAVGRVRGNPADSWWGLDLHGWSGDLDACGVTVDMSTDGKTCIGSGCSDKSLKGQAPVGQVRHPAIRGGAAYNRLLFVCRGDEMMTYINGELACGPVRRPATLVRPRVGITAIRATSVEVDRLTVYALPPILEPPPGLPPVFGKTAPDLPDALRVHVHEFDEADPAFAANEHGRNDGHYAIVGKSAVDGWHADIIDANVESDFAVEAVARVRGKSPAAWGIDLRNKASDPLCGINVAVSSAGSVGMDSSWRDEMRKYDGFVAATRHAAVRAGAEYNRLLVVARGDELRAYVNGVLVCGPVRRPAALVRPTVGLTAWRATSVELDRLVIYALPPAPAAPATEFAPLFNGRDLTGWKTSSAQPGKWRVENGVLIGTGPAASHLYSERDYDNVHVRAEVRINNGGGGVFVRSTFGPRFPVNRPAVPFGYEGVINSTATDPSRTGTIFSTRAGPVTPITETPVKPGQWFTFEVIADGNRVRTLVDGAQAAEFTDVGREYARGRIALQVRDAATVLEFRKVEVKPLSAAGSR